MVVGLHRRWREGLCTQLKVQKTLSELCEEEFKKIGLNKNDIAIGIAASGRTPYVIGGLRYASLFWAARLLVLPAIRVLK